MATNKLTEVAGLVAQAVMGAKVKDKDGNAKTVKPTGDDNLLDLTDIGAFGGGSGTGGGDNPNNNGANYIPGLLSDGSLTGRKLEWQGSTSASETTTVKFTDDLGTSLNLAGDGLQFVPYMNKTLVTRGVTGASSKIPLIYSEDNTPVKGSFVTTQYLPISINRKDLVDGSEIVLIFDGIGEDDSSATELKSPEIHIKFNTGDNSIDISQVSGYAYDNLTDTKTGEEYSLGISSINTFYTQKPVAQLPSTIQLFTGSANGPIALSGQDNYYSNVPNGIEVTFDSKIVDAKYGSTTQSFGSGLLTSFKIPKEALIIGSKFQFNIKGSAVFALDDRSNLSESTYFTTRWGKDYLRAIKASFVEINSGSISVHLEFSYSMDLSSGWQDERYVANVSKVTPY